MSEDSYLFENKKQKQGKWWSRLAKFLFFVIAFILVGLTILANMGGPHDMYKESVERFTSELFGGRPAKVSVLHQMKFFPSVGVHATNIKVYSKPEDEGGYPVVTIGDVEAFMSFWSVVGSQPKFKKFVVQNVSAIKGIFAPEEFSVHEIFVDHSPGEDNASLIGNGKIGSHKWSFDINLEVFGGIGSYSYRFQEAVPFELNIADIKIEGDFIKGGKEFFKFNNVKITQDEKTVRLNLDVYAVSGGLLKIKGDIKEESSTLEITSDLLLNKSQTPHRVTGALTIHNAELGYSNNGQSDLVNITNNLRDLLGYDELGSALSLATVLETGRDVNITLRFDQAKLGNNKAVSFEMPYIHQNGFHKLGALTDNANKTALLPPVAFIFTPEGKGAFVVMEGDIDNEFAAAIFNKLPGHFAQQTTPSKAECGIGVFLVSEQGNTLERFDLHLENGAISSDNQILSEGKTYQDIELKYAENKNEISKLNLDKPSFDFVHKHLKILSPNPTKCEDLLIQIDSVKETAEEKE